MSTRLDELRNLIGDGIGHVFSNLRNIEPDDQMVSWAVSFRVSNMHIDGLGPWGLQITGEAILALPLFCSQLSIEGHDVLTAALDASER